MKWFQFPSKIIELESQGPFCYSLAEQKQSINKHLKANYPNMWQKYEWRIFSCFLTNYFRWLKKIFINSPHTEKHSLWLEVLFRVAFCFLQEKPRDIGTTVSLTATAGQHGHPAQTLWGPASLFKATAVNSNVFNGIPHKNEIETISVYKCIRSYDVAFFNYFYNGSFFLGYENHR